MRFDVIIPAHNEEAGIAEVVRSVQGLDWPPDCFRVVVVADNCTDGTADIASRLGADVLLRDDPLNRGKGHALAYAFNASSERGWAHAVAVIDADSRVTANLIEAMAARFEHGENAVQVHYGVLNTHASWRTQLMAIAMAAFHRVRSRARERLGLSCGIRGNGWGLTHALLKRVPYTSYSITEDLEFGIDLGMRAVRVAYADEAACDGQMVSTSRNAGSQRRRWEQGRVTLLRTRALPLIRRAFVTRSLLCADLAADLLVLPLSYVVLNVAALLAAAFLLAPDGAGAYFWTWLGLLCCGALAAYILRGWQLSGTGWRGLLALSLSPFFLLWKLALMLRSKRTSEWIRTGREHS